MTDTFCKFLEWYALIAPIVFFWLGFWFAVVERRGRP